jgi:arsenate reductase (thioredoxin)
VLKPKVLFLCGANACRTQMAEGFLRDLAGDRFDVISAGYEPAEEVCADAIDAMREVGIDISGQRPKVTDQFLGERVNYVITLCDREKERKCPIFPGVAWRLTWALEDPQAIESPQERRAATRRIRDEIRRRVVELSVKTHKERTGWK